MPTEESNPNKTTKSRLQDEQRSKLAQQVVGSDTIMRSVLPDFARIAVMIQNGVRARLTLDTAEQATKLADLMAELTGFFSKVAEGRKLDFELYWDEFIATQNSDRHIVKKYVKAAVEGRERRLILKADKYLEFKKEVGDIALHHTVVLSRKGETLPIGDDDETIPEDHFGVAVFWERGTVSPKIKKIVDRASK